MESTKNNPAGSSAKTPLVIERIFDAPRHLVFEAWTKKEYLDQWMAPPGFTIPFSEGDFRPGGAWRCRMVAPDGAKHSLGGVYQKIIPDELLVFTHAWEDDQGKAEHESIVTVRFADLGHQTKLTFEQGPFKSEESRRGHQGGWTECLEKLGELLTNLKTSKIR